MSTLPIDKKAPPKRGFGRDRFYLSDEFRFCGLPDVCDWVSP